MNKRKIFGYLWTIFAIALVCGILIHILSLPPQQPEWQGEWKYSDCRETDRLINCQVKQKAERKTIPEDYTCKILGENWEVIGGYCKEKNYDTKCKSICKRKYEEFVCEIEKECFERIWVERRKN